MILTFKVKVLKSATLAKYWSLEVDFDNVHPHNQRWETKFQLDFQGQRYT